VQFFVASAAEFWVDRRSLTWNRTPGATAEIVRCTLRRIRCPRRKRLIPVKKKTTPGPRHPSVIIFRQTAVAFSLRCTPTGNGNGLGSCPVFHGGHDCRPNTVHLTSNCNNRARYKDSTYLEQRERIVWCVGGIMDIRGP